MYELKKQSKIKLHYTNITYYLYKKEDNDCNNPYLSLLINDEQQREQQVYCFDLDIMQFRSMDITDLDNQYKIHDLDTANPFWKNI